MSVQYAHASTACIAEAAWREARGATHIDRWGTIRTVLNRLRYPKTFARTPCGVVYQKTHLHHRTVYQFSWARHHSHPTIHHDAAYQEIVKMVPRVLHTKPRGCEKNILFFATPGTSIGVPSRTCMGRKLTFRVPLHKPLG